MQRLLCSVPPSRAVPVHVPCPLQGRAPQLSHAVGTMKPWSRCDGGLGQDHGRDLGLSGDMDKNRNSITQLDQDISLAFHPNVREA